MTYVQGFVAAVPAVNKEAYRKFAEKGAKLFREFGATRIVEAWGDNVPDGKTTDFKKAVQAKAGEIVVFGWQEFPSKAAAEAAYAKMMSDPRMGELGVMPYDGQRMIFGGFDVITDERNR